MPWSTKKKEREYEKKRAQDPKRKEYIRQLRIKHRDKILVDKKTYRENNKEKVAKGKHDWYLRNKDSEKNRVRAWIDNNRDKHNFYVSNWRDRNREKSRNIVRKRRAILRVSGNFTYGEWLEIKRVFDYVCAICKKSEQTIDHIIPLSKGGKHIKDNIQPLCRRCNSKKGDKINA